MNIILYLLQIIQYQYKIISQLLNFICRYIPLKQWNFDDSHSPKHQKFKVDELPRIISYEQDWKWNDLIPYYEKRYGKTVKPTRFSKAHKLRCPHCSHILEPVKNRKHFIIHKCKNPMCSYYLHNLRKVKKEHLQEDKYKYKLHYIYREFQIDFFKMDLNSLPKSFKFIADGYSAYPLAAQQFFVQSKGKINFDITQVIGLTNDDAVSKAFRPYKQMIERLNRTYKQSYRPSSCYCCAVKGGILLKQPKISTVFKVRKCFFLTNVFSYFS